MVPQKLVDQEENAEVLCGEVKRLAAKVSGLTSVVEQQAKQLREVNEEVFIDFVVSFCEEIKIIEEEFGRIVIVLYL